MSLFSEKLYLSIVTILFTIYQREEIVPAKLKAVAHFRASLSHAIQLWCLCNAIDFDVMHAVMACVLHTTEPLLPSSQFSIQSHHQLFILFQFHSQFPPHSHSHCFLYFHNHSCRYRGHYLSLWEVVFCVYRELDSCR